MPRITVPLPETILFSTDLTVQVGDLNYGNHLSNDAVLRLCHEARMRWLHTLGWSELNAGGAGLIMADAAVQYLAQAHYADALRIDMGAADIGRGGFALLYHIVRRQDGKSLARVQTGMVCFDYAAQKVCRLPQALQTALQAV
ncbi:acyl-CoA thioesterase [Neisseria perflava]|uniref:acyl-CoA thioesterase n=1 Tax=Neisseria perflava TaxID=33053 RepID=UPI00209F1FDF|nr:thioesterase family protein [Neisseria perflava]MCP1659172.1 acyl-CoA thioesterase FadM [Neisseria perflava]MCP1771786.1 acyl-CoA thioesterase FadM [Neisseria perflava]